MIRITGIKTFGKKGFKVICNTDELLLVNLFGFGFWWLKSENAKDAYKKYRG